MTEKRVVYQKQKPCPQCEGLMDARSKLCRNCFASTEQSVRLSKAPCPVCGGPMSQRAKTCARCRYPKPRGEIFKGHPRRVDVDFGEIDREWLLQFVGFFLADGCAAYSGTPTSYKPLLRINLRADDLPLLYAICGHFGGSVGTFDPHASAGSNLMAYWQVGGYSRVEPLTGLMLTALVLPARKVKQLHIIKEWCAWRRTWGNFLGKEGHAKVAGFVARLRSSKVFKVPLG